MESTDNLQYPLTLVFALEECVLHCNKSVKELANITINKIFSIATEEKWVSEENVELFKTTLAVNFESHLKSKYNSHFISMHKE